MLSLKVKVRKGSPVGRRPPRHRSLAIARAWAAEVEARVFREGKTQGGRPSYVDHGGVKVPAGYGQGGTLLPNGATYFASSGAMRQRGGYASTSKGMAKGLIVKNKGRRAVVEFTGSSMGANPVWLDGAVSPQQVSNQDKASTVLEAHKVNVLEFSPADIEDIRRASESWLADQLGLALSGLITWRTRSRPRSRFGNRLLRER